jgi:hypothetical protein
LHDDAGDGWRDGRFTRITDATRQNREKGRWEEVVKIGLKKKKKKGMREGESKETY